MKNGRINNCAMKMNIKNYIYKSMTDRFELANQFKQKYSENIRLKKATSPCKYSFTTSLTPTNNLFLLRNVKLNP